MEFVIIRVRVTISNFLLLQDDKIWYATSMCNEKHGIGV